MVMDPNITELSATITSGIRFDDIFLDQIEFNDETSPYRDLSGFDDSLFASVPNSVCDYDPSFSFRLNLDRNSPEDCEIFPNLSLKYISQILLEEEVDDLDEQSHLHRGSSALQAVEKPFYEILGGKYDSSSEQPPLGDDSSSPDCIHGWEGSTQSSGSGRSNIYADGGCASGGGEYSSSKNILAPSIHDHQSSSFSEHSVDVNDGLLGLPAGPAPICNSYKDSYSISLFEKGREEAIKFLPNGINVMENLQNCVYFPMEIKEAPLETAQGKGRKNDRNHSGSRSRGKKNPHPNDLELEEGRSNKQTAILQEDIIRSEMFDRVLLSSTDNFASTEVQEALKDEGREQSNVMKGRGRPQGKKNSREEMVDLKSLLIQCAKAIVENDWKNGNELLSQIKRQSSRSGDSSQRLAHYFVEGLEARLAGTGSQRYMELTYKRGTTTQVLKGYQVFLAACPFLEVSLFSANQTILDSIENATRVHIIDFSIGFGFQWPSFFQRLSSRTDRPPKIRITAIYTAQPGFRPSKRADETGRRLTDYAESFGIPFEYIPMMSNKWETIQVEDINIENNEVLVVNCLFQFHRLADETEGMNSPRDLVLQVIRKMNPNIFIHGIVNGCYNSLFFMTRFREALFHFSSLFDMLEVVIKREHPAREEIESGLFGRDVINIIACEGSERVERPEIYKQWQIRTQRAGFSQLQLNQEITKKARLKVRSLYHRDFSVDENSQWLLQGWKGRIFYALSSWKPCHS